jgi:glycerol-3-phosphate dehydrogenase (NAD(P)+)
MKIAVCGSGRWGAAMACYLAQIGHQVALICNRHSGYQFIKAKGYSRHLPQFRLASNIKILPSASPIDSDVELIIFAVPIPFFRSFLQKLQGTVQTKQILMSISKGIEQETLLLPADILKEFFPHNTLCHLGGPCFPEGLLLEGKPAAETLACSDEEIGRKLQAEFSSSWFRIYQSTDLRGVCFLGAIKNIFAIIAGIIEGKKLGEEALSILITRGIYEIKKICKVLQIVETSLYGLSGLGDLVLTCYSHRSSQNKNFGIELGKGKSCQQIRGELGEKICEGYFTTKTLFQIIKKHRIEAPLIAALYRVLYEEHSIEQTLHRLLARPLKSEAS